MRIETGGWLSLLLVACAAAVIVEIAADADVGENFFAAVAQVMPVLFVAFVVEVEFSYARRAGFFGAVERARRQQASESRQALAKWTEQDDQLRAARESLSPDAAGGDSEAQRHLDAIEEEQRSRRGFREEGERLVTEAELDADDSAEVRRLTGSLARRRVFVAAAFTAVGEFAALIALSGGPGLASAVVGYGSIAALFLLLLTDLLARHGRFDELPMVPEQDGEPRHS